MTQGIAFITGGSTGIGAAVATQLASEGIKVAIADVNSTAGEQLATTLGGLFIHCDVTSLASVEQAMNTCLTEWGSPTYIHLNAGIMTVPTGDPYLGIEDVSEAQYRKILGVNLDGVYHGFKTAIPVLRKTGGAITITASTAGLSVVPVDPLYTATKYALVGFTRAVAAANEGSNIRINAICPGVVDTAIVPDDYKGPEFGMMPTSVMAAEIVDLLKQGKNGEIRVKVSADRDAFTVDVHDLS